MKNKEIVSLPDTELNEKIKEGKANLNKSTLNHAISPVEDPSKITKDRKIVARMLTEVSKRKNTSNK